MNTLPVPQSQPEYPMASPSDDGEAPGSPIQVRRLFVFLLKFWWIPALTLFLGLGATGAYIYWSPPTFVSKARMWETVKLHLPEGSLFAEDMGNFVGTQTELLKSTAIRELALARLRSSSTSNKATVPVGKDGEPLPVDVHVSQSSKSSVFVLEASGSNPAYTQAYLDALMAVYLEYKKNVRKVVSGDTLASISEEMLKQDRDLKIEQDILSAFQRTNNMAILQEEGTIAGGYLARLKTQLSDLQLEDRLLTASVRQPEGPQPDGANTNSDLTDPILGLSSSSTTTAPNDRQVAFREVEVLKIQRERLSKNLRPKHPKIVKLDAEIERSEKLLEIYRRQSREQLAGSQQGIQLKIANVQSLIKEWEAKVIEANTRIAEAERLKLNVQRVQLVYDRLLLLVQNVGISRSIDQETLSILEQASLPKRSYSRDISLAAVGGVGGFGLGLALVLLIALRDDRFNSVLEIQQKLGDRAVVGQVPDISQNGETMPLLLEHGDQRHVYAESYRNLRSALLFLAVEGERPKVLLITSALPNEGKSTVAANLARTLALGGARVLLVDGDLRKGTLHTIMGLQPGPGLSELLQKPEDLDQFMQSNSLPNLRFISAGARLDNPGDLFLSQAFDDLLTCWRARFDHVVIDSSPVFATDDATTLAPKADGTLFVVRNRFSGAQAVREALEVLCIRQAKILGVVFNCANASDRSYHYYKYASYYPVGKDQGTVGSNQ